MTAWTGVPQSSHGGEMRRYGVGFGLSILLHLLILILLSLWVGDYAIVAEPEEISVPLQFEAPDPTAPAPRFPEDPAAQPETTEEEDAQEDARDDSLLGFKSEGETAGQPLRPVGPVAEIHGQPLPGGEEAQEDTLPEELPVQDDLRDAREPEEILPEERIEPAPEDETPSEFENSKADPVEQVKPVPERATLPLLDNLPELENAPARRERADHDGPVPLETLPEVGRRPPVPERNDPSSPKRPGREGPGSSLDYEVDIEGGMFDQNLQFDSRDYSWTEYSTKVYFAVWRAWLRELYGRARRFERDQRLENMPQLVGQVDIRFVINRSGNVTNVEVLAPSTIGTLDEASSAALTRAVLPPLPDDFPRDSEGATFRFLLSIDSALEMERQLRYRQSRGEF